MSDRRPVEIERANLAETLRTADPLAPTLCAGWRVVDLLAHLVMREHRPDLQARDQLSRAEPGTEKHLQSLVADALVPSGYDALVNRFAAGPGPMMPFGWMDNAANLLEYVVHHEDVRRGARGADGNSEPAEPREDLDPDLTRAVWAHLGRMAGLLLRGGGTGVVLAVPGGPRSRVRRGSDTVAIVGDPVELAVYAFGRRGSAEVALRGAPEVVEAFEAGIEG